MGHKEIIISIIFGASVGAIIGKAILVLVMAVKPIMSTDTDTDSRPHCPAEDSCYIDYKDGQWWITDNSGRVWRVTE